MILCVLLFPAKTLKRQVLSLAGLGQLLLLDYTYVLTQRNQDSLDYVFLMPTRRHPRIDGEVP